MRQPAQRTGTTRSMAAEIHAPMIGHLTTGQDESVVVRLRSGMRAWWPHPPEDRAGQEVEVPITGS